MAVKEANWLPAPEVRFALMMWLRWPKATPPSINRRLLEAVAKTVRANSIMSIDKNQRRKEMKKVLSAVIVFCVLFLFIIPVCAQDKPADTNQLVREKIQADKKLLVAENMQLTEAEAKAFWPVYESYQKDQAKIVDRTQKLINDYAQNYQIMTDATAKKLIDDLMVLENDRLKLRKDYLPKFRKVLSDKKVARYYQLENKIHAVVSYELAKVIPLVK
jgi:hypothetical protein